mmetsp:Transcript_5617/g.12226  ORF Transcript_5617/g.12226 Transcript_5617/m.12226 type:complete len:288 (+) Transcript_5617:227-1090(+)
MATAIDFEALMKEARQKQKLAKNNAAVQDSTLPSAAAEEVSLHDNATLPARPRCSLHQEHHRVHSMPQNVYHLNEWLSEADEELLLNFADASPSSRWTQLRGRRLQNLGGLPQGGDSGGMIPEPLPKIMISICQALVDAGIFDAEAPPNHVLVNEYQPGQGIEPHRDGPIYAPRVAILSLGSQCRFDFVHNDPQRKLYGSLLLPRKGLLIFDGEAYTMYLHSVPQHLYDIVPGDTYNSASLISLTADTITAKQSASEEAGLLLRRQRRVSLTFRRVLHVVEPKDCGD